MKTVATIVWWYPARNPNVINHLPYYTPIGIGYTSRKKKYRMTENNDVAKCCFL
jgi:hypothetical protein